MLTKQKLLALGIGEQWLEPLLETFAKFGITTAYQQAGFIGQCLHESGFKTLVENLNYSKEGLVKTWPSRFTTATAAPYHRNPERIANRVYADRLGNGSEASGEGWKYRGRGLIQLTGKANYRACADALGVDLVAKPELVAEAKYACLSAGWFWNKNNLNLYCDNQDWVGLTRRINGGTIGLDHRIQMIKLVMKTP